MSLDLNLRVIPANTEVSAPTVLLIHGFASSSELNWERSGWVRHLADHGRKVALIDLPGHGAEPNRSPGPWTPSKIRESMASALAEIDTPIDILGYSLGARLAWEFAAKHPELVRRLVIGGPGSLDPLAALALDEARRFVATGESIADEYTAKVMKIATNEASNDFSALFKLVEGIKDEPYDPGEAVPSTPTLLVAGDQDDLATTMPQLRRLLAQSGTPSEVLWLAGRNHANAVTSREFKNATLEFLSVS
ncbi:alpha/beta fold hydrolase [Glutamicibacter uratoxydans]|uniref:alpha/beta fold hydrolase n=1 Tax=Glutamicibacter uratoxydans TaxID=43667 RepID=UPI003D700E20